MIECFIHCHHCQRRGGLMGQIPSVAKEPRFLVNKSWPITIFELHSLSLLEEDYRKLIRKHRAGHLKMLAVEYTEI